MTEELRKTIASSREDLSSVARRHESDIVVLDRSLEELSVHGDANDEYEDDRISAEAQLSEKKNCIGVISRGLRTITVDAQRGEDRESCYTRRR